VADSPAENTDQDAAAAAAAAADPGSGRASYDRGTFLAGATIGLGAVMSAIIAVPALGFVVAPAFETIDYYNIDLGPADNFKEDDAKPWTAVTFESRPDDSSGLFRRVAFVRRKGDEFTALSNTCMHLGCPVVAFGPTFGCPCHGGQYDEEGRRTAGPPPRPLNRYETSVDDRGHLILGELHSVNDDLEPVQLKPPGIPANGVLSLLYPPSPQ
jgi:Rieske Fe-S protein